MRSFSVAALAAFAGVLLAGAAQAQISGVSPGGQGVPSVGIFCMDGSGNATVCAFSGGGGSNAAAGTTGANVPASASYTGFSDLTGKTVGVQASTGRYFPVQDYLLDALLTAPGSGAASALAIQGVAGGVAVPVSLASLPALAAGSATIGAVKTTDGTNTMAVKAASTAAVATDPAAVVSLSPNSPIPTGTNAIGNVGVAQGSTTSGQLGPLMQGAVTTGNPTYTTAQTSPISLTTSGAVRTIILGGNGGTSTAQTMTTASAANNAAIGVAGLYNSTPLALTTGQATGFQQDSAASLYVDAEGVKTTYSCSAVIVPAATPTDVFSLVGSATKTVRIRSIRLTTLATTAGTMTLQVAKRSTADTAGTSTAPTVVPLDSNNAAGTAVCKNWSANPTTGTLVGYIDTRLLPFPLAGAANTTQIDFGAVRGDQAGVLRGVAQELDVNLAGGALPAGASVAATIEFTEE